MKIALEIVGAVAGIDTFDELDSTGIVASSGGIVASRWKKMIFACKTVDGIKSKILPL